MLEGEHSAKQKTTMNISVCSQMPLSWLLTRKFAVRKAIVLTKMRVSKCLHKATRGGQENSKGKGPLERGGFSGTPPFPVSWLASDFTALNRFSQWRCGSMLPRRRAQVARGVAAAPRSPGAPRRMCSPRDGGDTFPSGVLRPRALKLKAVGQALPLMCL